MMAWEPPPSVAGMVGVMPRLVLDEEVGPQRRQALEDHVADQPQQRGQEHDRSRRDGHGGDPVAGHEPVHPIGGHEAEQHQERHVRHEQEPEPADPVCQSGEHEPREGESAPARSPPSWRSRRGSAPAAAQARGGGRGGGRGRPLGGRGLRRGDDPSVDHQRSTPTPDLLREMMTEASMLVTSVIPNSTRPAAMSADVLNSPPPARRAMKPDTVAPPFSRMRNVTSGTWGSRSETAMVSPSALAQAEHRPADDAAAAEGQHDHPDHAPACSAERQRRLLLTRWRLGEHLSGDRGHDRQHHQRDDGPGDQHGPGELGVRIDAEDRDPSQVPAEPLGQRFDLVRQQQEAPEAVQQAGDGREEVDEGGEEAAPASGGVVGDEQGRTDAEWYGDDDGDDRHHDRAARQAKDPIAGGSTSVRHSDVVKNDQPATSNASPARRNRKMPTRTRSTRTRRPDVVVAAPNNRSMRVGSSTTARGERAMPFRIKATTRTRLNRPRRNGR